MRLGALEWLRRPDPMQGTVSPLLRRLGIIWVCVALPVATVAAAFVETRAQYVFVWVFLGFGPYTLPGLFASRRATRRSRSGDRLSYQLLNAGVVVSFASGLVILAELATGARVLEVLGVIGVWTAGALIVTGVAVLIRRRSGHRALSVDVIEAAASIVALVAPLVVLWWPAVVGTEDLWALASAGILVCTMTGAYWVALLWVRLGPGPRGVFEGSAVLATLVGSVSAALQVAQGISGFTLWAPPLVALTALCASSFLLTPLYAPFFVRDGFQQLPPQAQVRGAWLPTLIPLVGIAALLAADAAVADERSWAVPFTLVVLALLAVLAALHHAAALVETKRIYSEFEAIAGERRQLLDQLLERLVADREQVAQELRKQAIAAYASIVTLAAADASGRALAEATRLLRDRMARDVDAFHDLLASMRQRADSPQPAARLLTVLRANLTTIYGEAPIPDLTLEIADDLVLDWVVETVLLQIVHEALDNVRRHGEATTVRIAVEPAGSSVIVTIIDDGAGFDLRSTAEGTGLATMRASAAAVGGALAIESQPGSGTRIVATLGSPLPTPVAQRPRLRLV